MRPITSFMLRATVATALTAFAATPAAAQLKYLALGDSIPGAPGAVPERKGGGWIEIQGWDWGETRTGRATFKEFTVTKKTDTASAPSGDPDRPLIAGRVPNAGVDRGMKKSGEKGRNAPASAGGAEKFGAVGGMHRADGAGDAEAESTLKGSAGSGGAARRGGMGPEFILRPAGRIGVASGDVDGDGRAAWDPKNDDFAVSGRMGDGAGVGTQIGKAIGNASTDGDDSAAPAEKRQHGWVTVPTPRDRGAVRVNVKTPWVGCRVGTRYPQITLGDGAGSTQLQDVTVASCARESISLNYAKVIVRGWDPATKQR